MKSTLVFAVLALLATEAHASELDEKKLKRECKKIELKYKNDDRVERLQKDFIRFATVSAIKDASLLGDPEISPALKEKARALAKPEYAEYVDLQLNGAQKAFIWSYKIANEGVAVGISDEQLEKIEKCHISHIYDQNSLTYRQANDALIEVERAINFYIDEKNRVAEYQAHEESMRREAQERFQKLEERRQNPASNIAEIGQFVVKADSCTVSSVVTFGLLPVAAQSGSKFLVLQATFKNTSNFGQTIDPGSVLIDYKGRSYTFNVVERILGDPLEVPETPINPLISQKVRVVYRIPDEISGKVRFQPGRNPQGLTVKCGVI